MHPRAALRPGSIQIARIHITKSAIAGDHLRAALLQDQYSQRHTPALRPMGTPHQGPSTSGAAWPDPRSSRIIPAMIATIAIRTTCPPLHVVWRPRTGRQALRSGADAHHRLSNPGGALFFPKVTDGSRMCADWPIGSAAKIRPIAGFEATRKRKAEGRQPRRCSPTANPRRRRDLDHGLG